MLAHGENLVAPLGLAAVLVVVICTGTVSWWYVRAQRQSFTEGRIEQVRGAAEVMAQTSAIMMARSEVSSLRTVIVQSALAYKLEVCRVVLSDGTVLADADPTRITAPSLPTPEAWLKTQAALPKESRRGDMLDIDVPFTVPGRGEAVLQLTAEIGQGGDPGMQTLAGFGLVGVAGLFSTLLAYRFTRTRVQRLGVLREALMAVDSAGPSSPALALSDDFGPEARAWNKLLAESESLRQQVLGRQAQSLIEQRGQGGGELQSACDMLWQGLLLIDDKLRVRFANGAAATFLRTTRDKLVGMEAGAAGLSVEVLAVVRDSASGAARAKGRRSVEVTQETGDEAGVGAGVLRFTVRPMRNAQNAAALVIIEDVTQQRVADAARNSFIAQATHELRMPLTNMRLYLEMAQNEGENDAKLRAQCLNVIGQESQRLERMVGDMLSVAEIEAGSIQIGNDDCRLEALFKELEDDYKAQAREKNITLAFNLPPKLPVIQADRGKLVLALHNMIGNAVKYTPNGGSVTVQVDVGPNQLTVDVRDTGIGIAPQDLEHVFEKFYRAKDKRVTEVVGSGLGLALAREIARLHGGDITVESQIDHGSTFSLTLPITVEEM